MEDIIITVLALALGLGFKFIEKKLKSAGKDTKAGRFKEFAEIFGAGESEVFPTVTSQKEPEPDFQETDEEVREMPVMVEPVMAPKPVLSPAPKKETPKTLPSSDMVKLQEDKDKPKEKIDPKKLVVYSEIMKPKYLE